MKRASPVFKSMLSSRFEEGSNLNQHGTVEVPLREDNPEIMVLICKILHHRNDLIPEHLEVQTALGISVLSDKDDFAAALKGIAMHWLAAGLHEISSSDESDKKTAPWHRDLIRSHLLIAAYYFRLETLFERVARDLFMQECFIAMPPVFGPPGENAAKSREILGQ